MRIATMVVMAALSLGSCSRRQGTEGDVGGGAARPAVAAPHWELQSDRSGAALTLVDRAGAASIRLICPAGEDRLLVNVPAFQPIASEERLSVGSGGVVRALVADPRGDARRGGVSGSGAVPHDLKALVAGSIAASYGAQRSGPHPALPDALSHSFVSACFAHASAAMQAASRPNATTSPCLVQDGELLKTRLRAVGTEPFWGAIIEGRCVTYSTPEQPSGMRVWTRFTAGPVGGTWVGALGGQPFEFRIDPTRKCSDGMSDKAYPVTVELTVGGERRRGCAE